MWPIFLLLGLAQGSAVVSNPESIETIRQAKSEELLKYLNRSADPCNDFYNFACGHWATVHPATRDKLETNGFQNTKDDMRHKILSILADRDSNDTKIDRNVKNFYESCTDTKKVSATYQFQLKGVFDEFGQMPALQGDNWQEADFDWWKTLAEISHKYAINIILGYKIQEDVQDNTVNRLFIVHPDFPLKSLSMYLDKKNERYRLNYQQVIAGNLKDFLNIDHLLAQEIAKEILDFEIALVSGMQRHTIRGKELLLTTTVEKLHSMLSPDLDIRRLLEISLGSLPSGKIFVRNPGYQTHLIEVIKKTPKKMVANYIFYQLLTHFLLPIHKTQQVLETKCLEKTKQHFANVLDNMVYRKYNTQQAEQAVQQMFHDLKANFQTALESGKYNWINLTTRNLAVEKLKLMKLEINSYQNVNFTKDYGQLTLNQSDYIENAKAIFALNGLQNRAKLSEAPKTYYDGAGMSFGPRYILTENIIKIPVATLQPHHFWSHAYPHSVNFGRLGFLIAHEMLHGFDDEGRTFDKLGNDRDWWDASSARDFANRTSCFRNQYKSYAHEGRPQRLSPLQSENIADNGGVRLAYETFKLWHDKEIISETLPNINYSGQQLFFISFAQMWCSDIWPEVRHLKLTTDAHEPGNLRVIGSLSNFEEFSKVFDCSSGSGMNPSKKCIIF